MRRTSLLIIMLVGFLSMVATRTVALQPSPLPEGFVEDTPITGFERPIAFAWLPDGRMVVGEKFGTIRMVKDGELLPSFVLQIAVTRSYDAGLLGIAVDPRFATHPYIYTYYTIGPRSLGYAGTLHNRVSRFRMVSDQALLQSEQILIDDIAVDQETNHNGGDLHFGSDGMLYVSVGDGGHREDAQNLDSLHGKILRVDPDTGQGVTDNPFFTTSTNAQRNRVWAYGLRNPFRFVFEPRTERMFVADVGWQTYEELNIVGAGRNYGWPTEEGPNSSGVRGVEQPFFFYRHGSNPPDSSFDTCSAIIGGDFVRGANFPPSLAGAYFFADYTCQRIWYMLPGQAPKLFQRDAGNIVHLAFGPDGVLYFTDILANTLQRVRFTAGNRPPSAFAQANPRLGQVPLAVTFTSAGSADPEGKALHYFWDFGDGAVSTEPAPRHVYTTTQPITATLRVTDAGRATSHALPLRLWPGNTAPATTITSPQDGLRVRAGNTVILQGAANDAEDGSISGVALRWEAVLHHGTSHTHLWDVGTGDTFRVIMPAPEDLASAETSFLDVTLTAQDAQGATASHTVRLLPDTVKLTFQTEPAGMRVTLDGQAYRTPVTLESAKGWAFSVRDMFQTTDDCRGYQVERWSNGRPPNHLLVTPNVDATITATLRLVQNYCYHIPQVAR